MANRDIKTAKSPQEILNLSFDRDFNLLMTQQMVYDPVSDTFKPFSSNQYATNTIDEASDTLTYIGKEDGNGAWLVQKIDTSSGTVFTYATVTNNPTYTTYSDAWTARASLTYNIYSTAL